jgi:hypothetical protein
MKTRYFTVLEILIVIAIIAILGGMLYPTYERVRRITGSTFAKPSAGQIYLVMAVEQESKLVIVMPYKIFSDDPPINGRRFMFQVKSADICKVGVWFLIDKDGVENIIESPIASLRPEKVKTDPQ